MKRMPLVAAGGLTILLGLAQCFIVINTSPSFPEGVYLKTYKVPQTDDLVLVCPPQGEVFRSVRKRGWLAPGLCESGTEMIIKRIVAGGGDQIEISAEAVSVNDQALPQSRRIFDLPGMIPVPTRCVLKTGEVLLMSPHPRSFDGRYFGVLEIGCVKTTLTTLFLWSEDDDHGDAEGVIRADSGKAY